MEWQKLLGQFWFCGQVDLIRWPANEENIWGVVLANKINFRTISAQESPAQDGS